jgi:predicted adenylyl cyclase CyaB
MAKNVISIEIKAKLDDTKRIIRLLEGLGADFNGEDKQSDTYFKVSKGRLKLREGNIENNLIQYDRPESKDLKRSEVKLLPLEPGENQLKQILTRSLGVDVVVEKSRRIYFIDNVKFHIDKVKGLGQFVEIEALDSEGQKTEQELSEQCDYYVDLFGLSRDEFIPFSYSDLLRKQLEQEIN